MLCLQTYICRDNRKYKRIFLAMTEVHSVQVVTERAAVLGLFWAEQRGEVPLHLAESRQSSGHYRIPWAQTSHPPGNRENGGNQRVREVVHPASVCSVTYTTCCPHSADTITDIIRNTWNKGRKMAHCSKYPLTVQFIHYSYSSVRLWVSKRLWMLLWTGIQVLIKDIMHQWYQCMWKSTGSN